MSTVRVELSELGYNLVEATFIKFSAKAGQEVKEGDCIAEVSTDKTTIEIPAPCDGVITEFAPLKENDLVKVGDLLATITTVEVVQNTPEDKPLVGTPPPPLKLNPPEKTATGPLVQRDARALAEKLGIDLLLIIGTGRNGTITVPDVEAYAQKNKKTAVDPEWADAIETDGVRRAMHKHMQSRSRVVSATVTDFANITDWFVRDKGHLLPRVILAMRYAAEKVPIATATFSDDGSKYRLNKTLMLGLAVASPRGLIVPVLKVRKEICLFELMIGLRELSELSTTGHFTQEQLKGGTIALSNFGSLGFGIFGQMVIPEGMNMIVGMGRVQEHASYDILNGPTKKLHLPLSITFDHTRMYGHEVCEFGLAMKFALEQKGAAIPQVKEKVE